MNVVLRTVTETSFTARGGRGVSENLLPMTMSIVGSVRSS